MTKPIVDLSGDKFQYKEKGTAAPIYTIHAKNEKQAYKKLTQYLQRLGILHGLENMERV